MRLIISRAIQAKLAGKHSVSRKEVEECFENREGRLLADNRESHKTDPPTLWFIAETNQRRSLKVVFVQHGESHDRCQENQAPGARRCRARERAKLMGVRPTWPD